MMKWRRKLIVNPEPEISNLTFEQPGQEQLPKSKRWWASFTPLLIKFGCRVQKYVPSETRSIWVGHSQPLSEQTSTCIQKNPQPKFCNNRVITSKYTLYNFLPKNLFEQFRRIANFYFLCVAVIQVSVDSPVSPLTSFVPLLFVVTVTAVKQGYEDWLRHRADNDVNNRHVHVVQNGKIIQIKSEEVHVGDIVRVHMNESFPCDLVLISTAEENGQCHITTANLDGETNLKIHCSIPETKHFQTPEQLTNIRAKIECQQPNPDLYKFVGRISMFSSNCSDSLLSPCPLNAENVLLKGARLKNTPFVYGCVVYTGQETKMALNSKMTSNKFSTVEKSMNIFLVAFLILLIFEVTVSVALRYGFMRDPRFGAAWYKPPEEENIKPRKVVSDMFSYLVLFNYIIPISMYVTIELQKFFGTLFFVWDEQLYDPLSNQCAKCNTSDLNEELGQVEFLFTDKTGTLTENDLQFRQCSINGVRYTQVGGMLCQIMESPHQPEPVHKFNSEIEKFMLVLALCHTVHCHHSTENGVNGSLFNSSNQNIDYYASSPDENALIQACQRFGIVYLGKSADVMEISFKNDHRQYQCLHILEFDSDRKCMSVIIRDPNGHIFVLCKGAEVSLREKIISGPLTLTLQHIDEYALMGLRTLMIAYREINEDELININKKLKAARTSFDNREAMLTEAFQEVERNLHLLGATAIEDRLQDGVCETLESLRAAGIKVWVLTGDKEETAVNISYSCGHFKRYMVPLRLAGQKSSDDCIGKMLELKHTIEMEKLQNYGLIVDGSSLTWALTTNSQLFYEVSSACQAVVCCRMSPIQKAMVVKLIKSAPSKPITAAIGDGANDVSMLQEAHVGLGLMGKEGRQAVRCSDFAFARFRFLQRVFLVHGHYYYIRVSTLVQYFFYKNVAFITPAFFYMFFTAFSDQPLFDGMFLTFFNVFFTSAPIFIYGLFEQNISQKKLLDYPQLYRKNTRNSKLSPSQFIKWNMLGLWHATVLFFGTMTFFYDGPTLLPDGQMFGNYEFGTLVMQICIATVNLKLAIETHHINAIFVVALCFSLFGFMIFTAAWNGIFFDPSTLYWVYFRVMASPTSWLAMLILLIICLIPDYLLAIFSSHSIPFLHIWRKVFGTRFGRFRVSLKCLFSKQSEHLTISQINIIDS